MTVRLRAIRSYQALTAGNCHSRARWLNSSGGVTSRRGPEPMVQYAMRTPSCVVAYLMRGSAMLCSRPEFRFALLSGYNRPPTVGRVVCQTLVSSSRLARSFSMAVMMSSTSEVVPRKISWGSQIISLAAARSATGQWVWE